MPRSAAIDAKVRRSKAHPELSSAPRRRVELATWGVVLAALPFIANRWWKHPGVLIGLACFYIAVALALRSRLIICTLAGVLLGVIFDNNVKGGTAESKAWEMVWHMAGGLAIGIVIGLAWDQADISIDRRERKHNASAKRR